MILVMGGGVALGAGTGWVLWQLGAPEWLFIIGGIAVGFFGSYFVQKALDL